MYVGERGLGRITGGRGLRASARLSGGKGIERRFDMFVVI